MPDSNLSRREWLERLSVPAVGAALSPSPAHAAPDQASPSADALNGARVYNAVSYTHLTLPTNREV